MLFITSLQFAVPFLFVASFGTVGHFTVSAKFSMPGDSRQSKLIHQNEWNSLDSGPSLKIWNYGTIVKHFGPENEISSVRAKLPLSNFIRDSKKPYVVFYFECQLVQIQKAEYAMISMGFSDKQFPLKGYYVGFSPNAFTFGMTGKFGVGTVLGQGIVNVHANYTLFFTTFNGQFGGYSDWPKDNPLLESLEHLLSAAFPIISLRGGTTVKTWFGKEKQWFDIRHLGLE